MHGLFTIVVIKELYACFQLMILQRYVAEISERDLPSFKVDPISRWHPVYMVYVTFVKQKCISHQLLCWSNTGIFHSNAEKLHIWKICSTTIMCKPKECIQSFIYRLMTTIWLYIIMCCTSLNSCRLLHIFTDIQGPLNEQQKTHLRTTWEVIFAKENRMKFAVSLFRK